MGGGTVQIVRIDEGKLILDKQSFKKVLKDGKAEDKCVSVISICGEYGKGKSLMANFCLQFLKNEGYKNGEKMEWLQEVSDDSIACDDPGIFLYQDVFKINEIAVLIMLVQGRFSINEKNKVFSQIFALGTLLSSVQIFNLQTQIQGKDVMTLKNFSEYANIIGAEVGMKGKKKVALKVLIRDWPYPRDNNFGYADGEKYLCHALESSKFEEQDASGMHLYGDLQGSFEDLSCFLMPHPGMLLIKRKGGSTVEDLDETFRRCVHQFIKVFLTPGTLEVKKITEGPDIKQITGIKLLKHAKKSIEEMHVKDKEEKKSIEEKNKTEPPTPKRRNISKRPAPKKPTRLKMRGETIKHHEAVPIITLKNGEVTLQTEIFETILNQPEIGNRPIALISIAGTFRKGKSFILNFFLRYVRNKGYSSMNDSWMGKKKSLIQDGFEWRSGVDPHTQGIMLFTEPFLIDSPTGEVVVLFMDTQGLFDANTTKHKNMMIFALNTILSSVQILNISMNLQESDIEFLQLFTEYARAIKNEDSESQFLQSLKFLIRDWQYPDEYKYGLEGGEEYLKSYMSTNNKDDELKQVREFIVSKYKTISCFLMPHPGLKLTRLQSETQLKDLEDDFREQLTPLAESILHPDKLIVKEFCGKPMSASALYASATKCVEAASGNKIPDLTMMMDVLAEANNNERRKECLAYYTRIMKNKIKSCITEEDRQKTHSNAKEEAILEFFTGKEFGGALSIKHVRQEIDNALPRFCAKVEHVEAFNNLGISKDHVDSVMRYKHLMDAVKNEPVPPNEFDDFEAECWKNANSLSGSLENVSKQSIEYIKKERQDFAAQLCHENTMKYNLVVDGLQMPDNYFKLTKQVDQLNVQENEAKESQVLSSEKMKKVLDEYQSAVGKNSSIREKNELIYKCARKEFGQSTGYLNHYVNLLEKEIAKTEAPKIQPNEKVMANLRLRRFVCDSLKQFDIEIIQYSGVFVRKNTLESLMQQKRAAAIERFMQWTFTETETVVQVIEKHRKDLIANLKEKIRIANQENERSRIHFQNAKQEMEKRIIKKYHSNMDQILQSGYIVESKLKTYHEVLLASLEEDLDAESLPFYSTGNKEDNDIFRNFKFDVTRKLNNLYQNKKSWNKKNHGVVVRAFHHFFS